MDRQIDMHYLLCLLPGLPGPHQLGLVLPLLQDGLVARLELVLKDDNLIQRGFDPRLQKPLPPNNNNK